MSDNALRRYPEDYKTYLMMCSVTGDKPDASEEAFNRIINQIRAQLADLPGALKEAEQALEVLLGRTDLSESTLEQMLGLELKLNYDEVIKPHLLSVKRRYDEISQKGF